MTVFFLLRGDVQSGKSLQTFRVKVVLRLSRQKKTWRLRRLHITSPW